MSNKIQKMDKDNYYHDIIQRLKKRDAIISHILGIEDITGDINLYPIINEWYENMNDGLPFVFTNLIEALPQLLTQSIPLNNICWINTDLTSNNPASRIFNNVDDAKIWINENGNLSFNNQWIIDLGKNVYDELILEDNILFNFRNAYVGTLKSELTSPLLNTVIFANIGDLDLNNTTLKIVYSEINDVISKGDLEISYSKINGTLYEGSNFITNCCIGSFIVENNSNLQTWYHRGDITVEQDGTWISYPISGIELSKTVSVNYDLSSNNEQARIFKSYQDAVTWIQANAGTLSYSNTWTVILPSGLITEVITKYAFIGLQASIGTVINELKSDIDYTIQGAYMYGMVHNFIINKITLENGKAITIVNCEVFGIGCDTDGYFNAFHSYILGNCDFDNISTVEFRNTYIGTNLTIDNLGDASFENCLVRATITVEDGQIVTFVNSLVDEAVINSGGTINNKNTYFDELTNNGTYNVLNKLRNSDVSPIEVHAGCTRYIEEANASKYQMIMKTGASTWEWVTIKENTW